MITMQNLNKRYGEKVLFKNLNFHLRPSETVGLVGENGTGKTTLFRVIVGKETLDAGKVTVRKNAAVAMLAQEIEPCSESILERAVMGEETFRQVKRELEQLEKNTGLHDRFPEKWSRRYGELQHEFERLDGYQRESRAKAVLSGLGFRADQFDKPIEEFSGGWRMRVELARLLLQNPDVLLLDEPTNHLDLKSVVWLESFLKNYTGSILLVSHDRRFLNSLSRRIIELDRGNLTPYSGNYDAYETAKRENEARLEASAESQKRRIAEIERFIERFRAKNTKATQVQSRIKMLNKIERIETATQTKSVNFRFPQPARAGRIVIELSQVDKSYGSVQVYKNLSAHLERGWKVAFVGENGAGKSTLLKLMAGIQEFQRGEIRLGANVTRAYYAQHHSEILNPGQTVLESLEEVADHLPRTQKHSILGAFLFSGSDVDKKVSVLSGGERSRLALARMLSKPSSLILLDEPTNHLDIRSCEFLTAALADYEGTLCTISHDRDFLDGIINRVWEIEDGRIREYLGNFSDYKWAKSQEEDLESSAAAENSGQENRSPAQKDRERKQQEAEERNQRYRKLKPLQSRLKEAEQRLEQVMEQKEEAERLLADSSIYQEAQKDHLLKTLQRQRELNKKENDLMKEWDEISSAIEEVNNESFS